MRTSSDPTEVMRVPGREYLAARSQAKLAIKRSRHRAVREMAAKCRGPILSPITYHVVTGAVDVTALVPSRLLAIGYWLLI